MDELNGTTKIKIVSICVECGHMHENEKSVFDREFAEYCVDVDEGTFEMDIDSSNSDYDIYVFSKTNYVCGECSDNLEEKK